MEITESGKVKVVGVRFRTAGKIYYFDPGSFELSRGMHVIVETARGLEYGFVVGAPMEVDEANIQQPLKAVIRISTAEDDEREQSNREREREAFRICRDRIQRRGLEMKLIDAEYTFDNSKILFYFTADGRIDFRELVKDLASVFRTRIELRQVGVRDETKILGGYGGCGRPLCCHTWLSDFVPVSIKMAKEQNLSLNPGKISGVCGRLMCCLKNEAEIYEELNRTLPHAGDEVESADGLNGLVESVNILRQTARIIVEIDDEKELHEYPVSDLTILRRRKRGTTRPTMPKNTQSVPKNAGKDAGRDSSKEGGKERGKETEKKASRNASKETSADLKRDAEKESGRDGGRDPKRNAGRDAGRNSRNHENRYADAGHAGHAGNADAGGSAQGGPRGKGEHPDRKQGGQPAQTSGAEMPAAQTAQNGAERDAENAGKDPNRKDYSRSRRDRRFERRRQREDSGRNEKDPDADA